MTHKIAIIGLGKMGRNHYNTLKDFIHIEIVGLCDVVENDEFE